MMNYPGAQQAAQNSSAQYQGAPAAPPKQTPHMDIMFKRLCEIDAQLGRSLGRINDMLMRFSGPYPEADAPAAGKSQPTGHIDRLNDLLCDIEGKVGVLQAFCERLESIG